MKQLNKAYQQNQGTGAVQKGMAMEFPKVFYRGITRPSNHQFEDNLFRPGYSHT